jgi:hypothetical protein
VLPEVLLILDQLVLQEKEVKLVQLAFKDQWESQVWLGKKVIVEM